MTLRDDSITMRQMLDNAQRAIKHTTGKSVDEVLEDELLGLALVRLVEVIGEAANRMSPETRAKYPQSTVAASNRHTQPCHSCIRHG